MKAKAMAWLLIWFMITQKTLISYRTEAFFKTEVACTVVAYDSLETFIQPKQTRISEIFFLMRDCQGAGHVDDDYFDNT